MTLTPEQLLEWERLQNRKPSRALGAPPAWCDWYRWTYSGVEGFDEWFGVYLGERSGRTGPDDVGAKQHCACVQCVGEAT